MLLLDHHLIVKTIVSCLVNGNASASHAPAVKNDKPSS